jgi:CDP-glycerol glycerophosphotransferase
MMQGLRAKIDYELKHHSWILKMFRLLASTVMRFWGMFVKTDPKMVLFSALGRQYNDSPKAIYEAMLRQSRFKDFQFVWALENLDTEIPGHPIRVKADSFQYFRTSLKARYWITSVNIERSLRYKKKDCIYLNTWHGVSLNAVGNGVPGRDDFDFSHLNYFCYESEWNKRLLMQSFKVPEHLMLASGLPRNDALYHVTDTKIMEVKQQLGLPLDKKIILYAPTWRDSDDQGKTYSLKPPIHLDKWEERLGDHYILLFRTHHYTTRLLGVQFNDFVRDVSNYPSINDLFIVSDLLISDYSSCITDYSILERPVVCFAYDYDAYSKQRGINIDFRTEMPAGIQKTEDEVLDHILNMDEAEECRKTREMLKNRFTYIGGHATEICINAVFGKENDKQ